MSRDMGVAATPPLCRPTGEAAKASSAKPAAANASVEVMLALGAAQAALWQYRDDLRYPPTGDSLERRKEMASRACAMVDAAIAGAWLPINSAPLNKSHVALLAVRPDGSVSYGHGWYMPLDGWQCWKPDPYISPTHWFPLPDPFAASGPVEEARTAISKARTTVEAGQ